MKTNIIKTAAVTLAIAITVSANAQNTKSLNENNFAGKLSKLVKENVLSISNELNNLKQAVQYKPEANFDYATDAAEFSIADLKELETAVKFAPKADLAVVSPEMNFEIKMALEELKMNAQYYPNSEKANEDILADIANELEDVVRFTPAS